MNATTRLFCGLGALFVAAATMLGAFGTHSLEDVLTADQMNTFQSGVSYHFYQALGLFAVAFAADRFPASRLPRWSGWLIVAGIFFFSGSIYLLTFGAPRAVVMVAPLGGLSFMVAWLLLAIAAFKSPSSN